MPIFEYECRACSHPFEVIVSGSAEPECPSCGSRDLQRRLSVFAVGVSGPSSAAAAMPGACGTCGDPRGPGSCSLD